MDMGEALHNNVEQMPPRRGFGRIAAHLDDSPVNIALRDCRRGVQQFSVPLISTTNANTKPHPCPCPQPSPMSVPRAWKPALQNTSPNLRPGALSQRFFVEKETKVRSGQMQAARHPVRFLLRLLRYLLLTFSRRGATRSKKWSMSCALSRRVRSSARFFSILERTSAPTCSRSW